MPIKFYYSNKGGAYSDELENIKTTMKPGEQVDFKTRFLDKSRT